MLHYHTIEQQTLTILRKLQELKPLQKFALAGGTGLALKFGHRISMDIDLFGVGNIHDITPVLDKTFKNEINYEEVPGNWAIFSFINDIKVDIIPYGHPLLAPIDEIDGIRIYSNQDILAMKISAILGRGTKKDFWDLFELLHHYSISEVISFYQKKFPKQRLLITIPQALTYFDDAENSPDPKSLKKQTWTGVKTFIQQKVREYLE